MGPLSKLLRTEHKLTRYELDIVREALRKYGRSATDEQDAMTSWMLFDRLKREHDQQIKEKTNEH